MTGFLAAESGIQQLHARCIDAVWRRDTDALVACFVEDAEWKISGMVVRGRPQIGEFFDALKATWERVEMTLSVPILEVGSGVAAGRSRFAEYIRYNDGRVVRSGGIYYERFVERGGRWLFQWRHCDFYYFGPPDFSAPFYDHRDYGPPPGMPGPDDPTTVLKDG